MLHGWSLQCKTKKNLTICDLTELRDCDLSQIPVPEFRDGSNSIPFGSICLSNVGACVLAKHNLIRRDTLDTIDASLPLRPIQFHHIILHQRKQESDRFTRLQFEWRIDQVSQFIGGTRRQYSFRRFAVAVLGFCRLPSTS